MKKLLGWACLLAWAILAASLPAASAAKKKAPAKSKTASGASKSKKSSSKSRKAATSSKKSSRKAASSKSRKKAPVKRTTWRNRQLTPTPERYKEIQDALAAKGYLSADAATGSWGPGSVDALKKFQADQHLDPTGKINSLSLIALGLGPKREAPPATQPPEAAPKQADR